jgi:hypothetical protein
MKLLEVIFMTAIGVASPVCAAAQTSFEITSTMEFYPELDWPDFQAPQDISAVDPTSPNAQAVMLANEGKFGEALEVFLRLADEGLTAAKVNSAVLLYRGRGVNPDYVRALAFLEEAAAEGDTFANYMLGRLYYEGQAVDRSMARSNEYFSVAREGPAAPEAAWWLANVSGSVATDADVWIGHCLDAYSFGHRLAIESCQDFGPFSLEDFVTPRVRQTEFALRLVPWYSGLAIELQYVADLFSDNDSNLRQKLEDSAPGYRQYYAFDVMPRLSLIGSSGVRAVDLPNPVPTTSGNQKSRIDTALAREKTTASPPVGDKKVSTSNWDWSSFENEGQQSVIGCSDTETDDSWLCLAARCDAPGNINLYIELTNLDVEDELDIIVGEKRFGVVGTSDIEAPYSSRLDGDTEAILAALKSGAQAMLDRPHYPFNAGYDTIPLRGSSKAISALEAQCSTPAAENGEGPAEGKLPLQTGIYVREGTACDKLTHAATLRYTGAALNAQRVEGAIQSVNSQGDRHVVTISAHDIAEDHPLGELEWTLTIPQSDKFTLEVGTDVDRYRWCFDSMPAGAAIS